MRLEKMVPAAKCGTCDARAAREPPVKSSHRVRRQAVACNGQTDQDRGEQRAAAHVRSRKMSYLRRRERGVRTSTPAPPIAFQ